jgi:hypothetical protein
VLEGERMGALGRLKAGLHNAGSDRSWHDVLEAHSLRLQNRFNPILRALSFEPNERAARLLATSRPVTAPSTPVRRETSSMPMNARR